MDRLFDNCIDLFIQRGKTRLVLCDGLVQRAAAFQMPIAALSDAGGNPGMDAFYVNTFNGVNFNSVYYEQDFTSANTGGAVNLETVSEQLLYEVGDPRRYLTPDVHADFTGVRFRSVGVDRVAVEGASGRARPERLKVSIGYRDGHYFVGGVPGDGLR